MKKTELELLLKAKINPCRKCGQQRKEMSYFSLSDEMKDVFKEWGYEGKYLFCDKCEEYGVITEMEFGGI